MRKTLYTLFSSFLLIALFNSAYAYDGQSNVIFETDASNQEIYFVEFSVDFVTPESFPENTDSGSFTVFIWPGLQPLEKSKCFFPINNGVLQPVLTWGGSCAPFKPEPQDLEQWWISGQYVNTFLHCDSVPDEYVVACESYFHCHGGQFITVIPGQEIETSIVYQPATQDWLQTIEADGQTQTYSIALNYCSENSEPATPVEREPQSQTRAILSIETKGYNEPLEHAFENVLLKIHVGKDPTATCDNALSTRVTVPSSSCTPFNTISNANGILTCQVDSCTVHKPTMLPGDTDNDGVPNGQDADADNDGIPNAAEGSGNPVIAKVNGNKQSDVVTFPQQMETVDTDGDGIPNILDLDSDGDGIPDHFEAGGNNDANVDGMVDSKVDSDGDGLVDAFDPDQGGSMLSLPDTDGDGVPDFLDTDSDNDGISDTNETMGCVDANGDGKLDDSADANRDGLADSVHPETGTPCALLDTDGDGIFDHLDSVDSTSQGGGCSVAPVGSSVSTLIYPMVPILILIRRLWCARGQA
jgi:hypothetical protein